MLLTKPWYRKSKCSCIQRSNLIESYLPNSLMNSVAYVGGSLSRGLPWFADLSASSRSVGARSFSRAQSTFNPSSTCGRLHLNICYRLTETAHTGNITSPSHHCKAAHCGENVCKIATAGILNTAFPPFFILYINGKYLMIWQMLQILELSL